jgi:ABC-type Na+ transport system ATPase subunit NatA
VVESGEIANGLTYGGLSFTQYPITIYGTLFRRLFAYAVGFAFVAYYPTLALLERADPLGAPALSAIARRRWRSRAVIRRRADVAGGRAALSEHRLVIATSGKAPRVSVIETRGLRKAVHGARKGRLAAPSHAGRRRGRRDRSHVERGEMIGYIGPNGAGKSTTLKMLTGVLYPSAGHVKVCGLEPVGQRTRLARRIGVVFGQRSQLWWDLPLRDSFMLLQHVYAVPAPTTPHGWPAAAAAGARPPSRRPGRQLSLGQRMRGELTAALLHGPEVLFLDEPTIGLDVVSKQAVRGFLATLGATGDTTIVLTTHDLADIERLCRRLIVIDQGASCTTARWTISTRGMAPAAGWSWISTSR